MLSASVGVLNWVSKFYTPTDSEHKFHKRGIKNWLLICELCLDWKPAVLTTTLSSTTNGENPNVLYTQVLE